MTIQEMMVKAKEHIQREPALAVYMVRDYLEVVEAELDSLAWMLASERYGCHKNDAIWFFEELEKYLTTKEAKDETVQTRD